MPQELGLSDYVVPKMKEAALVKFDTGEHLKNITKLNVTIDLHIHFVRIQYLQFINSPPGIYVICFLLVQLPSYMRESKKNQSQYVCFTIYQFLSYYNTKLNFEYSFWLTDLLYF